MPRAIDHLVLATCDLDQTAGLYSRMGFTVGACNRHSWGTLNHIVQLDGSFLELISTEPGFVPPQQSEAVWHFAGFIDGYLARGEGFAMLVLESKDGAADAERFADAGIGAADPFFFERQGKKADGTEVHVAFTLAFAHTPATTEAGFSVCHHHFPEAFWSPGLQQHANGARNVSAVMLCADDPGALVDFMQKFSGARPTAVDGGWAFHCARGSRIEILTADAIRSQYGANALPAGTSEPRLIGYRIAVADLEVTRACLEAAALPFIARAGRLVLTPATAAGTALVFESG